MIKDAYDAYFTLMAMTLDQIQHICDNPMTSEKDIYRIRKLLKMNNETADKIFSLAHNKEDMPESVHNRLKPHDLN